MFSLEVTPVVDGVLDVRRRRFVSFSTALQSPFVPFLPYL